MRGLAYRMALLALAVTAVALFAPACEEDDGDGGVAPTPTPGESPYMPLAVGNKWVYEVEHSKLNEPTTYGEYTLEVTGTIKDFGDGFPLAYVLTGTGDADGPTERIVACWRDRLFVYVYREDRMCLVLYNALAEYSSSVEAGVFYLTDTEGYAGRADVDTPLGHFVNCIHNYGGYGSYNWSVEHDEYYVSGVGLVYAEDYAGEWGHYEPISRTRNIYRLKAYELR